MMEEVAVLAVIFGTFFGIFYLFFSTRNKERLALIEKGVDAKIFMQGERRKGASSFAKVFILNIALLLIGIGIGIAVGSILYNTFELQEEVFAACILISAGSALLVGFNLTKKMDKE
ncbi:MAG: hypothetical protein P8H13_04025 [Polaribacter sp.]|nr:hypothetical protein [Polaribacter sp.]MDG1811092.1 hypothetical protein [Polaribacter sp.]